MNLIYRPVLCGGCKELLLCSGNLQTRPVTEKNREKPHETLVYSLKGGIFVFIYTVHFPLLSWYLTGCLLGHLDLSRKINNFIVFGNNINDLVRLNYSFSCPGKGQIAKMARNGTPAALIMSEPPPWRTHATTGPTAFLWALVRHCIGLQKQKPPDHSEGCLISLIYYVALGSGDCASLLMPL